MIKLQRQQLLPRRLSADINYAIGTEIANAPARPTWNKESFFGKIFGKDYNTVK